MDASTQVGNSVATDVNGNPLGFFGTLGAFAGSVAPLVTAIKGTNGVAGNATNPTTIPATSVVSATGLSTKTMLLIGGGLLVLVAAFFMLRRK